MNEPIIGRSPDLARPVRRGSERCACCVHLCPAVFIRDIATGRPLSGNIVETEIRRNFLQLMPRRGCGTHGCQPHTVSRCRAVKRRSGTSRRSGISCPLGAIPRDASGHTIDQLDLPGAMVVALQRPGAAGTGTNRAAIDDVRIFGMYGDKAAFPGAGIGAVAERDGTPGGGARRRDRGVVLLCGINAIGILVVGVDAIETAPSAGCRSTTRSGRRCSSRRRRRRCLRSYGSDRRDRSRGRGCRRAASGFP